MARRTATVVLSCHVQPVTALIGDELGDGPFGSEYIWANTSQPWHTPKLTTILKQRTGQDLGQELGTLQYRHAAVGIGRRFVGNNFAKDYYKDETGDVEEPEVATEDPLEMSAGRGSAAGARRSTVPSRQSKLQRPNPQQWNRVVRKALVLADLAPVAYKSPEQEQALERIMNDTDPALVVVLPTGGGKSLLFIVPACLDDSGMTIVVLPYRQLIAEILSDAVARGIEAVPPPVGSTTTSAGSVSFMIFSSACSWSGDL
ncbi:hypothetical protein E4U50_007830 [Claviceps purpurea]|nr:hypothetical protein E4U50_007830 [Claviceps purpurea]